MALGKYSRVDGRSSSSSYFSTVSLVVFVALCLVGVWMLTSSSVVPVQNVDVSAQEAKDEVKEQGSEISGNSESVNTEKTPTKFEDSSGGVPDETSKGDNNVGSGQEENNNTREATGSGQEENNSTQETTDDLGKTNENAGEPNQDNSVKESPTEVQMSEEAPKTETKDSNTDKTKSDVNNETRMDSEYGSNDKKSDSNQTKKTSDDNGNKTQNADGSSNEVLPTETRGDSEYGSNDKKSDSNQTEKTSDDIGNKTQKADGSSNEVLPTETRADSEYGSDDKKSDSNQTEKTSDDNSNKTHNADGSSNEVLPTGVQPELLNETVTGMSGWKTQANESRNEKETAAAEYKWKLCNVTAGPDYIPCLDNLKAITKLQSTKHYEHRERHCPEVPPTCLVALPEGYQRSIEWPNSREKIWYQNVPHTKLAEVKGHQNWVKVSGNYLTFPGGGTQFKHGALHYIDFIQESVPTIAWGKKTRVILDVGCGVASFGGFLFDRDVLTMSFAPKDEHEAQVQFALERGIPGISAVMGTKRLPFPGRVFDAVHCARCRVPWHIEGGKLLLELNRVLRPGGHFIWSATPVYKNNTEDAGIWEAMKQLTTAMCWDLVSITKDKVNGVAVAIYHKPVTNECYQKRLNNEPPVCPDSDDPDAAWNVRLQACMHQIPTEATERGSKWPEQWSNRLTKSPYWLTSNVGVYGKPAPEDFTADSAHWKRVVDNSYLKGMGIKWSTIRNVMDMKAVYGGFAAALKDLNVWVMNVVPIDSPDTLPVIYERGLFGIYHDWCESFNTYPRSYDLLHADHLFSQISKKCNMLGAVAETDRILRPEGKLIIRDKVDTINELKGLFRAMYWEIRLTYTKDGEGLLLVQKTMWRPTESETITYAIG